MEAASERRPDARVLERSFVYSLETEGNRIFLNKKDYAVLLVAAAFLFGHQQFTNPDGVLDGVPAVP